MRAGALLLILLGWALCVRAASLSVQVGHAVSPLGAPINLTFSAQELPLEQLDLQPLARDFDLGPSTSSQSGDQQTLSLNLYPLHTGRIVLPAFRLGTAVSRPLILHITAGSDLVPDVTSHLSIEPAQLMVRQPGRLMLDICDDGSLLWKRPVLPTGDGLYQRPMGETQTQVMRNGVPCTLHRYVWDIMPTRAGPLSVRLPMLAASKFGTALRFPPPTLQFNAQAVPDWLPLVVPVGRLRITAEPLPARWPLRRPLAWTLTVQGGLGADELRHLLMMQLAAHPQLTAYPPVVKQLARANDPAAGFALRAVIYLRPGRDGVLHLPRLVFPWFDPATGELQAATLTDADIAVFNPLYRQLERAAALLGAAVAPILAGWWLRRYARRVLARRRCRQAIRTAPDAVALSRALRACAGASCVSPALTLGRWWERLPRKAKTPDLAGRVRLLEVACYGRGDAGLEELRQGLLRDVGRL